MYEQWIKDLDELSSYLADKTYDHRMLTRERHLCNQFHATVNQVRGALAHLRDLEMRAVQQNATPAAAAVG